MGWRLERGQDKYLDGRRVREAVALSSSVRVRPHVTPTLLSEDQTPVTLTLLLIEGQIPRDPDSCSVQG